ncbi:MAG: sodium:proton exchanger, partial [Dehalococcoidia bacterium]|nr:sodium:proton exchanger [Dehalococcoidia bacterium]
WSHLSAARLSGLRAVYSSVVSHYTLDELDLGGIGRVLAMSPVDEFNTLAVQHFFSVFGRANVYQLSPDTDGGVRSGISPRLHGRILFGSGMSFTYMSREFEAGASLKVTLLTDEFGPDEFRQYYGESAQVLFVLDPSGRLFVGSADARITLRSGHRVISMVRTQQAPSDMAT